LNKNITFAPHFKISFMNHNDTKLKALPVGWKWVKLGDITRLSSEKHNPIKEAYLFYIGLEHIERNAGTLKNSVGVEKISTIKNKFKKGDILYGKLRPNLNKVYIAQEDGVCSTDILVFQTTLDCLPNYLLNLMLSRRFVDNMSENTSGINLPRVSTKHIQNYQIPLPPLPIQSKIVAQLELLLSELDNGKTRLLTAQTQLKIYRQAVLKAAFEGKLTGASVTKGTLPTNWKLQKLNEIGKWTGGGTPSKNNNKFWENGTILWVSPKDMKSKTILDTIDKITPDALVNSSAKLIPKASILFVMRSGILRRTLPVAITICEVTVNQDLQALTPKNNLVDYIYWAIICQNEKIRSACSKDGTTVESIESITLKNYAIPICPIEDQYRIVEAIETRLSICDHLEATLKTSLAQSETLRQSLLKKAFEGTLI
jgi:type I restriction enzyme, S subunit